MPRSHPLPVIHAVMDDADAMQRARADQPDPEDLVSQVDATYRQLGLTMDRSLIEQAVTRRSTQAVAVQPENISAPFDFGWDRPATLADWKKKLQGRMRRTAFLEAAVQGSSSVAFFVWLWLLMGSPPRID